ncbi:type VI secretion system Vgr family protein [Chryseobacterium sp.]|uniref:type VI secretion system Vgr family protein n=1 Tax=Chryseobacterium sp. TaxID=1871047 RepID=UPI00388D6ECF
MFQDNNTTQKANAGKSKNVPEVENLKDTVAANTSNLAQKKLNEASDSLSKLGSVATSSSMFMNQPIQSNTPYITEGKAWAPQPTSKIHNAAAIVANQILGINRVVKLDVIVEGTMIPHFKHFKLVQSAVKHHTFELTLAYDALGSAENHNLEEAQNFLGKRITVVFKYKDVLDGPERNFIGVITEVGFSQEQGSLGNIVLIGHSPTLLLDAAPHIQSFGGAQEISLNSIADQVIREGLGASKFDFRVDAKYGNVPYSCQYEETHYNYLARIAEAYGEQFFYDGEVLHFGKLPPQNEPVKLTYGSSVNDVKVRMKAQHVNPSFYGYNSSKNEKLLAGASKINHVSDIAQRAYDISTKTFTTPSLRVAPIRATTFMDIDASQKGTAGSKASEVFLTSGSTTVPFLYPGCAADIEMRQADSNKTTYFTKLLMVEVTHEVDARGYYTGHFDAIAADSGYIPRPEFQEPRADAQFAKVISNTDPQNQGRVKVQFDWQKGPDTTEFIRVMTPDAGSSDKVSKNRGFMAIPEVGDQVVVNFAHQHPDRPFVMGGIYHGKVGGGGGAGNNVRSFSSKSGNIIALNDGAGIEIKDRAGNHVTLSGTGNLTTEISNDYTEKIGNNQNTYISNSHKLVVTNMSETNVNNHLSIDVGAGQSKMLLDNAGNVSITSSTNIKLKVGASSIEITANKISISSPEVDINGAGATANFKGATTIKGTQVDIN